MRRLLPPFLGGLEGSSGAALQAGDPIGELVRVEDAGASARSRGDRVDVAERLVHDQPVGERIRHVGEGWKAPPHQVLEVQRHALERQAVEPPVLGLGLHPSILRQPDGHQPEIGLVDEDLDLEIAVRLPGVNDVGMPVMAAEDPHAAAGDLAPDPRAEGAAHVVRIGRTPHAVGDEPVPGLRRRQAAEDAAGHAMVFALHPRDEFVRRLVEGPGGVLETVEPVGGPELVVELDRGAGLLDLRLGDVGAGLHLLREVGEAARKFRQLQGVVEVDRRLDDRRRPAAIQLLLHLLEGGDVALLDHAGLLPAISHREEHEPVEVHLDDRDGPLRRAESLVNQRLSKVGHTELVGDVEGPDVSQDLVVVLLEEGRDLLGVGEDFPVPDVNFGFVGYDGASLGHGFAPCSGQAQVKALARPLGRLAFR